MLINFIKIAIMGRQERDRPSRWATKPAPQGPRPQNRARGVSVPDVTTPQRTAPKVLLEHVATGIRLEGVSKGRVASLEGNHLCQECDGTGWVLYRSETINGGFEEAHRPSTRGHAPRYCMGYCNDRLCTCPPVPRWCAAREATAARITSRIHDGRDVDNACEAIWHPGAQRLTSP